MAYVLSTSHGPFRQLSLADFLAGAMLGEGDFISVQVSAVDAVVVTLTGAESA